MYCKNCGKQVDSDSIFCSFCGSRQSQEYKPINSNLDYSNFNYSQEAFEESKTLPNDPECIDFNPKTQFKQLKLPRKEKEAMSFGILTGITWTVLLMLINNETIELGQNGYNIMVIISSILRIIVTIWIIGIAKRIKRNQLAWGLFGFIIPALALIIIGNLTYNKSTKRRLQQIQNKTIIS